MTLRRRLLGVSLLTLAVGLGALLVAANVLLAQRVRTERSSLLHEQAQAQIAALDVSRTGIRIRETANDAVMDRRAWVLQHGRVLERPRGVEPVVDRAAVALGRAARDTERAGPDDVHLLARAVRPPDGGPPVGAVVVARSDESVETLRKAVLLGSFAVALIVLIAAGVVIRAAIEGALAPVATMTEQARDWSEHDLDGRFGLGPPRDELSGLAAMLDRMLARIAASRRHDQRFASEVAHELRTPIAGLRGRAELALAAEGEGADAERRDALRAVIDQVDRVQAAVDALLAVARHGGGQPAGSTDVAELVAEHGDAEASVPADLPRVEGEPELVRRALAPLVENARAHSRSRVAIEATHSDDRVAIVVDDDGDGVASADAERIFEPGVRGPESAGAGLGLPLARRLARACGGDVVAEPGRGHGRFVLTLPVAPG